VAPHSRAYTSNCEDNWQLSLQTNKIFCGDRQKASLLVRWRYNRSGYSRNRMHVKDGNSVGTDEIASL